VCHPVVAWMHMHTHTLLSSASLLIHFSIHSGPINLHTITLDVSKKSSRGGRKCGKYTSTEGWCSCRLFIRRQQQRSGAAHILSAHLPRDFPAAGTSEFIRGQPIQTYRWKKRTDYLCRWGLRGVKIFYSAHIRSPSNFYFAHFRMKSQVSF